MYKLFLCLRYLRSRVAAWLAVLAVTLCVFMLVVSIGVMDGFVATIEVAAKGLYGDVVIDGISEDGLPWYDEFIAEIQRKMPDKIEAASPFILTGGIMEAPFFNASYRQMVQIAGIRLPERVHVSTFGEGLTYQPGVAEPTFDPPLPKLIQNMQEQIDQTDRLARAIVYNHVPPERRAQLATMNAIEMYYMFGDTITDSKQLLQLDQLANASNRQNNMLRILHLAEPYQQELADLEQEIRQAIADGTATQPVIYEGETTTKEDLLREQLDQTTLAAGYTLSNSDARHPFQPPGQRAIVGLGLPGFIVRTPDGKVLRMAGPGNDIVLTMIKMGQRISPTAVPTVREVFTIIDESRTDVSTIDSNTVYLPFDTLQKLLGMGQELDVDGRLYRPARTSQIHVKVNPAFVKAREAANNSLAVRLGFSPRLGDPLTEVAAEIEQIAREFKKDPRYAAAFTSTELRAQSWRERQRHLVDQIQSQRTLVVIMFTIISMVAVVLIFVIFYMIVLQKTKDIGVIKSLGGSSLGVASIFLGYGAATGLVGAGLGILGGWQFVKNINAIHDWVGRTFGFQVWNREWFMFDKIPSQVELSTLVTIGVGSIIAGLLGSLIPAIIASHMQPVRALRYE